jgi:hypothetical protein
MNVPAWVERPLLRHAAVAIALMISACSDEVPTEPITSAPHMPDLVLAGVAVADATDRIIPALGDRVLAARIVAELHLLEARLAADDVVGAQYALDRVERTLADDPGDPDLEAIRLALKSTRLRLPDNSPRRP